MALGRAETAERGSRDRSSNLIAKVFRSRTELRLKNVEKDFAGGEWKPMKLLCHKRRDVRETGKTSNESRLVVRRWSQWRIQDFGSGGSNFGNSGQSRQYFVTLGPTVGLHFT